MHINDTQTIYVGQHLKKKMTELNEKSHKSNNCDSIHLNRNAVQQNSNHAQVRPHDLHDQSLPTLEYIYKKYCLKFLCLLPAPFELSAVEET